MQEAEVSAGAARGGRASFRSQFFSRRWRAFAGWRSKPCGRRATRKFLRVCSTKNSIRWPIRSIPVLVSTPCASPCRARKLSNPRKASLRRRQRGAAERELSELLDRLTTRFGRARVLRFMQGDAHEPERESRAVPVCRVGLSGPRTMAPSRRKASRRRGRSPCSIRRSRSRFWLWRRTARRRDSAGGGKCMTSCAPKDPSASRPIGLDSGPREPHARLLPRRGCGRPAFLAVPARPVRTRR